MKTVTLLFFTILFTISISAQSTLDCSECHVAIVNMWNGGNHGTTQIDVADELAGERAGETPDEVINGSDPEDCISCHGALAVTANEGMTEPEALAYFFSTEGGIFTANTQALNTEQWPNVACVTCHNVPDNHPVAMPTFALYDSRNAAYTEMNTTSELCGQCHGSLHFAGTDHLRQDAWASSKHGHGGLADVGKELTENVGLTPDEVIADENCIACHASTAVLVNGGMSEGEALGYFFTTTNGVITEETAPQNMDMWPEVACITCHNPHQAGGIAYFNSSTASFDEMASSDQLCGQCHGNLRFPNTDHLSYNIVQGTGGVDVPDQKTMPGIKCIDCHMVEGTEDSQSAMFAGHLWKVFVEEDGSVTTSCNRADCHPDMSVADAVTAVELFQNEFADLFATAEVKLTEAEEFMVGENNPVKLQKLADAQTNFALAEGDESGGVHNHNYGMALLNDVIDKVEFIVTGIDDSPAIIKEFALFQNYPNPFNPSTIIKYQIFKSSKVTIEVFDILGKKITTPVDKYQTTGSYQIKFEASNMPAGVYFYRMKAGAFESAKKLILLK
ncbi:MAG: ammonia-forming cytochrome c nitrite reductase subunit c552 [Melioribacteraceae bacterium]|nr:ammonia-forming cytochrome c nitrite reductase subunit c552 [Melioribacteraceae bacterium]